MEPTSTSPSPSWGTNTKLVVALTVVVIIGALVVKFQSVITPLLIALVLSYLLHPVAGFFQQKLRLSWNASVSIIFVAILLILGSLLTLSGVGLVQQIQSLVTIVQTALKDLPQIIENFSGQVYEFGPFKIDFTQLDLNELSRQVLALVQPLLNQAGGMLGSLAGGAATFLGWTLFVLIGSYFVLIESRGLRNQILTIDVPGYSSDISRLSRELGRIWNAFLRGQIIIFLLAVATYSIVLSILGMRYAIGLAFLAGLARFVPYVGPAVNWTLLVIVAFFQGHTIFGLEPLYYTLLVLGIALIIDQIFDNLISPSILSSALKVHPFAVLIAAIVAASLFGILGVVVAAPILATVTLLWNYIMHKMLDLDPFPEKEMTQPPPPPGSRLLVTLRRLLRDRKLVAKK
ncbi:MAG TPA: AI-2E family transporter, partial [Anaerolineales bacterium]|nr:AI-2E family transporter [Anaerolineales bacterium]